MTRKTKKPWGVFLAIGLAVLFGSFVQDRELFSTVAGEHTDTLAKKLYDIVDVLGEIFLNALTLVVVPLVSASIISGISRVGSEAKFKRLGTKMALFYIGTNFLAILTGLFFVNLIGPGTGRFAEVPLEQNSATVLQVKEQYAESGGTSLSHLFLSVVPNNIISALSKGEMLGLIFFSLIFGFCISKVESEKVAALKNFFQGLFHVMIEFTHVIMKFLPYGVFCLIAKVFMTSGLRSLGSLGLFFATSLLALLTFMFVILGALLIYVGKVNPARHFKAMSPALVTAFSTSSSSASLPITIECVEKRAGVSNRICSLVVPLGTSVNMSGSALYECVAAMFVAQVYGIEISIATQFLVVAMALVTSIGVAGIPSASLVAVLVILKAIGLPAEGLGLFIAVDRILDMCRTTVNVFSDTCCAVIIAKTEKEKGILTQPL